MSDSKSKSERGSRPAAAMGCAPQAPGPLADVTGLGAIRYPTVPAPAPFCDSGKPAPRLVSIEPVMLRPLQHGGPHLLPEFVPRDPMWIDPGGILRAPPYVTTPAVPILPIELEQPWSDRTMLEYPNGLRVNGVFDDATRNLIVGWVEARAWERQFRFARLRVQEGVVTVATPPTTGIIGPRAGPLDAFGVLGLRSSQCTLAPTLARPALFSVVMSPDLGWPTTHYLVEIGGDDVGGAAVFDINGLREPVPAPAGIAFGRAGAGWRIAFAYARRWGSSYVIEFGFLNRESTGWRFQPSVSWPVTPRTSTFNPSPAAPATPVEDNPAVAFDYLREEWMVAWVPGSYDPGAFVRRIAFDGTPRGLPTLVKKGSGDFFAGHGGMTLIQNRITGRFLLAVSHNATRLESRDDNQVYVVTNGGHTPHPSMSPSTAAETPDPTEFFTGPETDPPGRGRVWAIAPCHVPGLEFRLGGEINGSTAGTSWVCSYPGGGFYTRSEGLLWTDLLHGNIHSYVSIPTYAQYAGLIVAPIVGSAYDYPYAPHAQLFVSLVQDVPSP